MSTKKFLIEAGNIDEGLFSSFAGLFSQKRKTINWLRKKQESIRELHGSLKDISGVGRSLDTFNLRRSLSRAYNEVDNLIYKIERGEIEPIK